MAEPELPSAKGPNNLESRNRQGRGDSLDGQGPNIYPDLRPQGQGHPVDQDGDGAVALHELKKFLPNLPSPDVEKAFEAHDTNKDGVLSRHEFARLARARAYRWANTIVLPRNARPDEPDAQYTEEYTCFPPPIFMILISIVELGIFIYHTHEIIVHRGWVGINGPAPIDSVLIYNPHRRYEAWRYLTYMLVHSGWVHVVNNVVMQLFLGVLLEMVHKFWRVLIVYFAGVIAGSLATSVTDPDYYLAGASGGVYALITAHMATVILNWSQMELPWIRVILFSAFAVTDVGVAVYGRYLGDAKSKVGYAAHFGGAVAGLLVGILVLRNLEKKKWEKVLWIVGLVVFSILVIFAVAWNIFYTGFPESRYD